MQGTSNKSMVDPNRIGGLGETLSFLLIFGSAFVIFMATALVGALLCCPWRSWLPGAEGAKSLTGGVWSAVYTFIGHLH